MNVLFLTIGRMNDINAHELYPDLLRQFIKNGHKVYVVAPKERKAKECTKIIENCGARILYVKIGNITKCNVIEKGISTLLIGHQYINALKKYFPNTKFDLVLYSTPPITLVNVVKYVKLRDNAKSYLLLKDIFPQNAVDLGMISKKGFSSFIYYYFRWQEKKLYSVSDYIGCMSKANVDYILEHNEELCSKRVEVCPNSIEIVDKRINLEQRNIIRKKYGIPLDKKVFIYGGNLGKPQGISFLLNCLEKCKNLNNVFFLIVGDGTEYSKLLQYKNSKSDLNMKLMQKLPKDDYDQMIAACDVGMIFLDHRFTIPNFPSRLLSYMQAGLPVVACTDINTDIGSVIIDGKLGWWCESNNVDSFYKIVIQACKSNLTIMGLNSFSYLENNYNVNIAYQTIIKWFDNY